MEFIINHGGFKSLKDELKKLKIERRSTNFNGFQGNVK